MKKSIYEIDLSSIWNRERTLFLDGNSSIEFAEKFLSCIEVEIVNKSNPILALADYEQFNENEKTYYNRKLNEYRIALRDVRLIFQNEVFFNNKGYYAFNEEIYIKNSHPDFMYWFALKLRCFQIATSDIKLYLDYQFNNNFNRNLTNYSRFLDSLVTQYKVLLDDIIFNSISNWLIKKRKLDSIPHSYKLISNELIKKNHQIFHEVYNALNQHSYISDTSFQDFKDIFNSERDSKSKKIVWIANTVELKYFVDYLYKNKIIIGPREKYKVAVNCFMKANSEEFQHHQIYGSRSLKDAKRDEIETILSKMIQCK